MVFTAGALACARPRIDRFPSHDMAFDSSILIGIISGAVVGVGAMQARHKLGDERRRREAEMARRETELHARELRAAAEEEMRDKARKVDAERLRLESLTAETERARHAAQTETEELQRSRAALEHERARHTREILRAAGLSLTDARKAALDAVRVECEEDANRLRNEILGKREDEVKDEARRILVDTMQRLTGAVVHETNAAIVGLPADDMKGRLIGREGRNIKTFETLTGTTLMIDETPGSVLVSSFDPVRREIARVALENLVRDGRIHPASIEHFVEEARNEVLASATAIGREAAERLGLSIAENEILELLGRLHFRLSANQNTLDHSVETAELAAMIAAELGVDPAPARRAGLLHDIGKAMTEDNELGHAAAGAALLRRLGDDPRVVNAVAAHHGDVEPESLYAPIIRLADSISASRPGARSSTLESYVERVKGLEDLAKSYPGVIEAHAVQAGREVRVIVSPAAVSEEEARALARKIRVRIEEEMQYPGAIRVILIREQRFQEEAK